MPPLKSLQGVPIYITGDGGPKVVAALQRRQGFPLRTEMLLATKAGAMAAKPVIAAAAPVLTGATKKSVKARQLRRAVGHIVQPTIWYRHFVIGGTKRGVKPNPWVARAVPAARVVAKAAFDRTLKAVVK